MKYLIVLFLFATSINAQSDSTMVENSKLIEFAKTAEKAIIQDSIIAAQNAQIELQRSIILQDSLLLNFKDLNIQGLEEVLESTNLYNKKKWYETTWFYYTLGSATMFVSSFIVRNVK